MPVVLLRLPSIAVGHKHRPHQCPFCGCQILQRWGCVARSVQDTTHHDIEIHRYRCCECKRTFRVYPKGVDQAQKTLRIRYLASLAWGMGMSYREVIDFFKQRGIKLSHTTVQRDSQEMVAQLYGSDKTNFLKKYTMDTVFLKGISSKLGVIIAIDLGDGKIEVLGTIDEYNPRIVKSWLEPLVKDVEIEVLQLGTGALNIR